MLHIIVGVILALLGAVGFIVGFIGAASDRHPAHPIGAICCRARRPSCSELP
jgi:hypothetical protein